MIPLRWEVKKSQPQGIIGSSIPQGMPFFVEWQWFGGDFLDLAMADSLVEGPGRGPIQPVKE